MARYTQDSLEKVRDAVDFAELVGARTELKRAGVNRLQGLCPFHEERTPSFGIDPVAKLYHCFGCGAGGDAFSFVMETEGLDFGSALESLAERYGVELERESEDPQEAERRVRRERLLALLERTAAYYVRVLWESGEAAGAREYLASRGLEEASLREFRVGYSPSRWDRVLIASRAAGYTEEELLAAGLAQRSRERASIYDRFRGRIMFPLADERGRVLGFGARAVTEGQQPKYLNTSDSDLFHKGRMVYGADLARAAAAKAGRVVLVEGYTDVIALRQAGVPETVCSMGTSLTTPQVDALAKLAPRVLFCQDPDAAGQKAVGRGLEGLAEHNSDRRLGTKVDFRIVRLPAGQDPADVALSEGADAMRALLEAAVPVARYLVERAIELGDTGSTDGRDEILSAAADVIAPLPPSVLREELVQLVAGRLSLNESLVTSVLADPARRRRARAAATAPAGGGSRESGRGGFETRGGSREGRSREPGRGGFDPTRGGFRESGGRAAAGASSGGSGVEFGDPGRESDDAGREYGDPGRGHDDPGPAGGGGRYDDPGPERGGGPTPDGARYALDRREQTERAYLAYCLALPDEGERRLADADLDELFASPATRRAAEYLRPRLRTPAANLPPGDEPLARLVAE
ncbi:MAG: primase, partial [Solirubrobacteraceae bacterium]|nr:primase [Solirubrobacteraceae bacterium]